MLEAGYDLYGTRRAVFTRVTLPLSMPGVVAGRAADVHPRGR